MFGWLFMLISVPRYYGLLFNIENISELGFLTQEYFSELSVSAQHPLLVGMLLGCTLTTIFYNLARYLYARFTSNLLLAIALSVLLLFLFFLASISAAPTSFYVNFSSDFIYAPIVLCMLFIHSMRSEEHTSELQSRPHLVCRLLLEKKKMKTDAPGEDCVLRTVHHT